MGTIVHEFGLCELTNFHTALVRVLLPDPIKKENIANECHSKQFVFLWTYECAFARRKFVMLLIRGISYYYLCVRVCRIENPSFHKFSVCSQTGPLFLGQN